jgi:hypothetical protein
MQDLLTLVRTGLLFVPDERVHMNYTEGLVAVSHITGEEIVKSVDLYAERARTMFGKNGGGKAEEVRIRASALFCSSSLGQVLIVRMTQIVLEKQQELIITMPGALGIILFRSFWRKYSVKVKYC